MRREVSGSPTSPAATLRGRWKPQGREEIEAIQQKIVSYSRKVMKFQGNCVKLSPNVEIEGVWLRI